MNKIPSFTVDHIQLKKGVYVSRYDEVAGNRLTTFDLRMKKPNGEPVLNTAEMHTLEHLGATYLRNHTTWKDDVIYFGPMGCRTGFYLILKGDLKPVDILELMMDMFRFMKDYEGDIPGASAKDCGNYHDMNLPMARYEAEAFLNVLIDIDDDQMVYPT